jgi:hypothetical protein
VSVTKGAAGVSTRAGGEQGSIIVVVILTLVIVLWGLAFAVRATGDLQNSRDVTNTNAARAQALAGLSDALFRLDQQGGSPSSFCVGDNAQCTVSSVEAAPDVQYTVRVPSNSTTATVLAQGTVHGRTYTVEATVAEARSYPFGIFAGSNITFDGSGSNITIEQTDASGNCVLVDGTCQLADVGSDGTITCQGSGTDGANQVTYDGGNSNCANWDNQSNDYTPQQPWGPPPGESCPAPWSPIPPPTPCMPTSPASNLADPACPSDNTFSGVVDPGIYSCTGPITFSSAASACPGGQTVCVDYASPANAVNGGKVEIFDWPDNNGQTGVEMSGAVVNLYDNTSGSCDGGTSYLYQCGDPTAFQVYVKGSGSIDVGSGSSAATFDGILYAPGMSMTVNGGQLLWIGRFTVNQVAIEGNPNFSVHYDPRLGEVTPPVWQVENFTVIPPGDFSLP